jgi:hypothetical protein
MSRGIGLHHIKEKLEKISKDISSLKGLITKMEKEQGPAEEKAEPNLVVAAYCDAWTARYKTQPTLGGKEIGILARLTKEHGTQRASALVAAYLNMTDSFFIKRRHDPAMLITNLQAIGHYCDSGKMITNGDAREAERIGQYRDLFSQIQENKL